MTQDIVGPSDGAKRRSALLALVVLIFGAALLGTAAGNDLRHRVFASLRIARPKPVTAAATANANPSRALSVMIASMLADTVAGTQDEADQPVPDAATAAGVAGFAARLPATRTDRPAVTVLGAREVRVAVSPRQLHTTLVQAGLGSTSVSPAFAGSAVTFRTPRAIRAQYGKCPEPVANTIQGQLQGPPPPSTDYGTCVILTETPMTTGAVPAGLDVDQLLDIALQLSGMSPNQAESFRARFDWPSALSLSLPRNMRSYDSVAVSGARGMLINTAGRRGPTYALVWVKDKMVFALSGYGSPADALPLATSLR